jgi:hypothetical protein
VRSTLARVLFGELRRTIFCLGIDRQKLEAPPGFDPGMEVLQTAPETLTCSLVLLADRPDYLVLPGVWVVLFQTCSQVPHLACRCRAIAYRL